jgi:hypothetical protein
VSERLLDLGRSGAALNGMQTMGVPQPVRRDVCVDAGSSRCFPYHAMHGTLIHALAFLIYEYRIIRTGIAAHLAHLAFLAGDRELNAPFISRGNTSAQLSATSSETRKPPA